MKAMKKRKEKKLWAEPNQTGQIEKTFQSKMAEEGTIQNSVRSAQIASTRSLKGTCKNQVNAGTR